MERYILAILVALFATNAFSAEIPKRVQKKILAVAPEIDLNSDGKITADELKAARDKLPENLRAMLDF